MNGGVNTVDERLLTYVCVEDVDTNDSILLTIVYQFIQLQHMCVHVAVSWGDCRMMTTDY